MFNVAVSGGCIINERFSNSNDKRFLKIVDILRDTDVTFSHLEGTISDKNDPEVYPAAEAGWTWIRTPKFFAEELKWAGIDIVSHASNHCLDYMYGGLYSTWKILNAAGLPFAGTGMNLSEARKPAYFQSKKKIAMISSTTSTPNWSRASDDTGRDKGRPGANQIRTYQKVDKQIFKTINQLAVKMGWWVTEFDQEMMLNPSGLHNSVTRYVKSDDNYIGLVADPTDVSHNIRQIRLAKQNTDFVIYHVHCHEWNQEQDLSIPPGFIRTLAKECIDAGADLFISEGSHAQLRGIEIYKGRPIFYDTGDLFKDGNSKSRPLSEYYWMRGLNSETGMWELTTRESDLYSEYNKVPVASNPPGGYNTGKVHGIIVPVCTFNDDGSIQEIKIYPASHLYDTPIKGIPGLQIGNEGKSIIDYVDELSRPYGTKINYENGIGIIRPN